MSGPSHAIQEAVRTVPTHLSQVTLGRESSNGLEELGKNKLVMSYRTTDVKNTFAQSDRGTISFVTLPNLAAKNKRRSALRV